MSRYVRAALALLLLTAVAVGCSDDGDGSGEGATPSTLDPDEVSRLVDGHLTTDVSGAVEFSFDRDVPLRVVTINAPDVSALTFFNVGIEQFQQVDGEGAFRIAVDLAGSYDGPGEYEIPAASGAVTTPSVDPENPDPNAAVSGLSKPLLTWSPDGDPTQNPDAARTAQLFDRALESCQLRIGPAGESGDLRCPK
ncbi:MAG TPA: hypothetical protein VM618_13045, partial [Acidimicrobiia bacterium]|nr:hypothetical protein [Acidimicrobiia bacterium]